MKNAESPIYISSSSDEEFGATDGKTKKIEYSNLGEVVEGGVYNVYGVVTFFTPPKKSKGGTGDWMVAIAMADSTMGEGLLMNLFAPSKNGLPRVSQVGEIFRAHGLKISKFKGKLQGVGTLRAGFNWVLIPKEGQFQPSSTSFEKVSFELSDYTVVVALRAWWLEFCCLQK